MALYDIPDSLEKDIADYEALAQEFINGRVEKPRMKAARVPMGVYEQRQDGTYMVRVRVAGGDIRPGQLKAVAAIAVKYSSKPLHLTTRQELQLHDIKLEDTYKIMKELKGAGLSTRGGGGNTVRNITGSFDEGIDPGEIFSVTPYVRALTGRLIAEPDSWVLPRKYKIAFSGSRRDTALACVNDLGFIAKLNEKGERGFEVYAAGGMGVRPAAGILLYDFVPHTEVYNIAKAVKILFDRTGNRKNKHAARLRFVLFRLGREEFIKQFEKTLEEVKAMKLPQLELKEIAPRKKGFIRLPVFLGDIEPAKAVKLAEIAGKFGEETIRLTPDQDILLHNLPETGVEDAAASLAAAGFTAEASDLDSAGVCAGASTCRLGVCLSRGMIAEAKRLAAEKGLKFNMGTAVRISGCPNTCGQHMMADIGFFGTVLRIGVKMAPAYNVVAGAGRGAGATQLAAAKGVVPAKHAPAFLVDALVHAAKHRKNGETFAGYADREGNAEIERLIGVYGAKPKDAGVFTDWGAQKEFSLADKMEGECSAGVFDLIDSDFSAADNALASGDAASAVAAASRALLITKGLEAKSPGQAVLLFRENFIGRHLPAEWDGILSAFLDRSPVDAGRAAGFIAAVKALYASMDNSLRFPGEAEAQKTPDAEKKEFRDFRGVKCPMNFVKTKLVLEGMKAGEKLEILLDDGEPIENVPASLKNEGHFTDKQEKTGNYWSVLIRKG